MVRRWKMPQSLITVVLLVAVVSMTATALGDFKFSVTVKDGVVENNQPICFLMTVEADNTWQLDGTNRAFVISVNDESGEYYLLLQETESPNTDIARIGLPSTIAGKQIGIAIAPALDSIFVNTSAKYDDVGSWETMYAEEEQLFIVYADASFEIALSSTLSVDNQMELADDVKVGLFNVPTVDDDNDNQPEPVKSNPLVILVTLILGIIIGSVCVAVIQKRKPKKKTDDVTEVLQAIIQALNTLPQEVADQIMPSLSPVLERGAEKRKEDIKIVRVTGITLSNSELILEKGIESQLTAEVTPPNATDKRITWHSGNEHIAIVDQDGKVTGFDEGRAEITVTTRDGGFSARCIINVWLLRPTEEPTEEPFDEIMDRAYKGDEREYKSLVDAKRVKSLEIGNKTELINGIGDIPLFLVKPGKVYVVIDDRWLYPNPDFYWGTYEAGDAARKMFDRCYKLVGTPATQVGIIRKATVNRMDGYYELCAKGRIEF